MNQTNKLLVIIALFWFAQYIYVPNTAPYLLSQKVTADFVGLIVGLYGGVQMTLRFPLGISADLLGRHKLIIIIGCCFSGGASIIRLLESNGMGFLVANICSGVASSLWVSFMLLYTKYIRPEHMQKQIGYLFAANNFGIMLAFIMSAVFFQYYGMDFLCLCSALSGGAAVLLALTLKENDPQYAHLMPAFIMSAVFFQYYGMDFLCLCSALSGGAAVLLALTLKENDPQYAHLMPEESNHQRPPLIDLLKVALKGRIWFFAFLASIQQGITMSTIMSFSNEAALRIGGTSFEMGIMTVVFILMNVVSSYYSGKPPFDRISQGFLVSSALALLGLYCFLSVMVGNIYLLIVIQIFLGWSFGFVFSIATSEAIVGIEKYRTSEAIVGIEKYRRSSAIGLFQALFAFGMTVVPIIAGRLIQINDGDLTSAFYFQGYLCLIGVSAIGLFQALFAFGMTVVPIIAGRLIQINDGDLTSAFYFQGYLCLIGVVATIYFYYKQHQATHHQSTN